MATVITDEITDLTGGVLNPLLDYETRPSVLKYIYRSYNRGNAQVVSDDYFKLKEYPHNITIEYHVYIYEWNWHNYTDSYKNLNLLRDIGDKVVDFSYTCDSNSNIKTSASLTLYVPPDDDWWYFNREYDIKDFRSSGSGGSADTMWNPQIYQIVETIDDTTRNLGYFVPDQMGYNYDAVTSQLSLQLQNFTYSFTAEGGGTLVMGLRSVNYYSDMPYNTSPQKYPAYKVESLTDETTHTVVTTTKEVPLKKDDITYEKQSLDDWRSRTLSNVPDTAIIGGTAAYSAQSGSLAQRTINTPYTLSVSGMENNMLIEYNMDIIGGIIYRTAMGFNDMILNNYRLPILGYYTIESNATKGKYFPNGWDFETGTDVMTIAETMLNDKCYDYMLWVDEWRYLEIMPKPLVTSDGSIQTSYYYGGLTWSDYGELVIDESISFNDNEFYTCVQVYGKDDEFYGVAEATLEGFKIPPGNQSSLRTDDHYGVQPKTKVITTDLESDEDCNKLALYELWKAGHNHTTITIRVRDNKDIFNGISNLVGLLFVEYKSMQGNGKTMKCLLRKATLSDNIWTWELSPFSSFPPGYDWYDTIGYAQFKSPHYDQFLIMQWNQRKVDEGENYISEYRKNTLSQPVLLAAQLIGGNTIRLYVSSIDIGLGVVKMYVNYDNGSLNGGQFVGESVNTNGTGLISMPSDKANIYAKSVDDILDGNHIYKIFDYKIEGNGTYGFTFTLYNLQYEESPGSNRYFLTVQSFDDGSTHYILTEYNEVMSTENDDKLTYI